jgi:hypothetical protein
MEYTKNFYNLFIKHNKLLNSRKHNAKTKTENTY